MWSLTGTRLSPLLARTGPITMCWAKQGYTLCVASPQPHSEGESGDDGTITRLECFDVLSVCSSSAHRGAPLLSSACVWAHTHDRVLSLRPSTGRNCAYVSCLSLSAAALSVPCICLLAQLYHIAAYFSSWFQVDIDHSSIPASCYCFAPVDMHRMVGRRDLLGAALQVFVRLARSPPQYMTLGLEMPSSLTVTC